MKPIVVLVINPDPEEALLLSGLVKNGNHVFREKNLAAYFGRPDRLIPSVIVADSGSISFEALKKETGPETAVILTGREEKNLLEKAAEWPPEYFADSTLIHPGRESWKETFILAFERAAAFARLKAELGVLQRTHDQQEEKMREVMKEIAEIRNLIKLNYIREVERRITVEAKYLWFQKERQRTENILRRIYEANDVGSLLDTVPEICDVVKAQSASVYVVDESENLGRFLKPILWDNTYLTHADFTGFVTSINSSDFASSAARYKQSIHITEIPAQGKIPQRYKSLLKTKLKNLLAVPIMHGSEVIGVIELYNKLAKAGVDSAGFSRDDRELLNSLSEHIALAMMKLNLIHYDALTGLLRPDPFFEMVLQKVNAVRKRSREEGLMAIVMGDVDWFKNYNDRNGQEAGNKLLRELAGVLKSSIREEDMICRYGGEEFVFFLTGIKNLDEACQLTERIRKNVDVHYFDFQEFQPHGNLTMSFGVTIFPKDSSERSIPLTKPQLKRLVSEADLAMAEAKGKRRPELAGREKSADLTKNRVRSFDLAMAGKIPADAGVDVPRTYKEMRRNERFNFSTLLMYKDEGVYKVAKTANLSAGGVKIITESRLPASNRLETILVLDDEAPVLKGDVIYSEKAGDDPPYFYSGMKFRDLTIQDISMLEKTLQTIRDKTRSLKK